MRGALTLFVLGLALAGCRRPTPGAAPAAASSPAGATSAAVPPTDPADPSDPSHQWLGRWDGPEGTYLMVTKAGDHYAVEIRDLDGSRFFEGFPDGGRIRFVRDGKTEFLTAGDGEAAGMKWLLGKRHCLLTHKGEGWCRD